MIQFDSVEYKTKMQIDSSMRTNDSKKYETKTCTSTGSLSDVREVFKCVEV